MQTALLKAIADDSGEKLYEFARNEVLFASFEQEEIELYVADGIEYEEPLVMPSKFDNEKFYYYVTPHVMGHTVKVGSNYHDEARVVEEDRITSRPFGSTPTEDVTVMYRAECSVDEHGMARDVEVIITPRP